VAKRLQPLSAQAFFDQIPRDVLEAAENRRRRPAAHLWSIVLPMSRRSWESSRSSPWSPSGGLPLALMVFSDTDKQPISVALVQLSQNIR